MAAYLDMYGLRAVNAERHAARGGLTREQLEPLVAAGMSIAELAAAVDRSKATVRHWLRQHGLKTKPSRMRRAAESDAARSAGLARTTMACATHGTTEFAITRSGYYRCLLCRSAAVSKRRRRIKELLVAEAGGRCAICGYRPLRERSSFPPRRPDGEALRVEPARSDEISGRGPRGGRQVRPALQQLPCRGRGRSGSRPARAWLTMRRAPLRSGVARSGVAQLADALGC